MIIILKNADFSASNIGTLSTWRISRSLGAGATYEGVTSVDKGASFNATITIAEGYEIGTAGVTVTMGGAVLSGAHSISGNVITITIASVTGNVLIKVPTVNTATGEEEEPEVPDEPGTGGGDSSFYTITGWKTANGGNRALVHVDLLAGDVINFKSQSDWNVYKYAIAEGQNSGSGPWIGGSYQTGAYTVNKDGTYTLFVARQDNADFTDEYLADVAARLGYTR